MKRLMEFLRQKWYSVGVTLLCLVFGALLVPQVYMGHVLPTLLRIGMQFGKETHSPPVIRQQPVSAPLQAELPFPDKEFTFDVQGPKEPQLLKMWNVAQIVPPNPEVIIDVSNPGRGQDCRVFLVAKSAHKRCVMLYIKNVTIIRDQPPVVLAAR